VTAVPVVSLADFAQAGSAPGRLDSIGIDGAPIAPLLALDLTGVGSASAELLARARAAQRHGLAVTVGVLPRGGPRRPLGVGAEALIRDLDLTLGGGGAAPACSAVVELDDVDAALTVLATRIARAPRAAAVLCGVARQSGALGVGDALLAESAAYSILLGGREFAAWLAGRRPAEASPGDDSAPRVLAARSQNTLEVALDRPWRRNALDTRMRDELLDALMVAACDPQITRVVIRGRGECFCAGGDLQEFGTAPDLASAHLLRVARSVAWTIEQLRERVTVRLHGACFGAGVELAAFAGHVSAARGTTLTLPELAMGLIPGAGGTVGVTRRIGRWRFNWLALSGCSLDAETARSWGLVDELHEAGEL